MIMIIELIHLVTLSYSFFTDGYMIRSLKLVFYSFVYLWQNYFIYNIIQLFTEIKKRHPLF